MKRAFLFLMILLSLNTLDLAAQTGGSKSGKLMPTSIGMVIYSNDYETVWNAMRLANYSKNQGDTVTIFLLGKGVELDSMVVKNTDLSSQTDGFLSNGGVILGCGTCLRSRNNKEPKVCTYSSLADLYGIIRRNKVVLTF